MIYSIIKTTAHTQISTPGTKSTQNKRSNKKSKQQQTTSPIKQQITHTDKIRRIRRRTKQNKQKEQT